MEIMESIRAAFKELIVPELDRIKEENREIRALLEVTNKRLDDVNIHLADQSRRIDSLREELTKRIESMREELTLRIDSVREELTLRIDSVREELSRRGETMYMELDLGIKDTNKRVDLLREDLSRRIDEAATKFDTRLDRLYEVIVRRDEHRQVAERLTLLERDVEEIKRTIAA